MFVWQRSIVDSAGNVVPEATITVRDQVTSELIQVYEDHDGDEALGNPFQADEDGFARFYARAGRYQITATQGGDTRVWEDERLGTLRNEIVYDPDRFKTNAEPGTTDMTSAIASAFSAANGGGTVEFRPGTEYLVTDLMSIEDYTDIHVKGNGATIKARLTQTENVWTFLEPVKIVIDDLYFDGGFGVTTFSNQVISMRSPVKCKVRHCYFEDYAQTAVLMFGNGTDVIEDCLIFDCFADGGGVANIGFLIGDCVRSNILASKALNVLGTAPGYTFQFKNFCEDSHILDCVADNCHIAVAMSAPDEADTIGSGALHCTARVIAKDCVAAAFLEKTNECEFDVTVDMGDDSGATAAVVNNARNIDTRVSLNVKNVHSTLPVIKHSSSDRCAYYVRNWDATGLYLWDIGDGGAQPGAENNRLILEHVTNTSASFEPLNLINDDSGETSNQFVDLRNLSMNALGGSTRIYVPVSGQNRGQNYIQFSSSVITANHGGVTKNLAEPVATSATNIANDGHSVNTANKYAGKFVRDTTNNRLMMARGGDPTDPWDVADGSASVTPS